MIKRPKHYIFWIIFLPALLGTGCSSIPFFGNDDKKGQYEEIDTTEQKLYNRTQRSLRAGNYDGAIRGLQQLEAQFPFGRYAEQAQLEIIYAQYMSFDHEAARLSADRFIRLHPQNPNLDYAYYLKGLSAFNKNRSFLDRIFSTDLSKRDITPAQQAYDDFTELLSRFPDSQYAPDANKRMVYLRNLLAESELNVARYYMRRGAYIAASNRARYVLENYAKSPAVANALAIIIEANFKLDMPEAANDSLRVLSINFPDYPAFDKNGNFILDDEIRNRDRSWTNMVTFGLLDRPEVAPPIKIDHPDGFVPPTPQETDKPKKRKRRSIFSWIPFVG